MKDKFPWYLSNVESGNPTHYVETKSQPQGRKRQKREMPAQDGQVYFAKGGKVMKKRNKIPVPTPQMSDDIYNGSYGDGGEIYANLTPPNFHEQAFGDGGEIHIKPSHRGKFTAWAKKNGHKNMSDAIAAGKASNSSGVRKMATFAENAKHWKHGEGGEVFGNGGQIGSLVGTGLGLASSAFGVPAPIGMSVGSQLGSFIGNQIDKPQNAQTQMNQSPIDPQRYGMGKGGMIKKMADGGYVPNENTTTINAEGQSDNGGGELIVSNGRIKRDLRSFPPHPDDGSLNPQGNITAQVGDIVVPNAMRNDYINADPFKRRSMEGKLRAQTRKSKMDVGGAVGYSDSPEDYQSATQNFQANNFYPQDPKSDPNLAYNMATNFYPTSQPQGSGNLPQPLSAAYRVNGYQQSPNSQAGNNQSNLGNVLGKAAPYLGNVAQAYLTSKLPNAPNPILNSHITLNKSLNIDPELNDIQRQQNAAMSNVVGSTSSGSVYRANAQNIYSSGQDMRNKAYADKANYFNQTDNQERGINAGIDQGNNQLRNNQNTTNMYIQGDRIKDWNLNAQDVSRTIQGQQWDSKAADMSVMNLYAQLYRMNPSERGPYLAAIKAKAPPYLQQHIADLQDKISQPAPQNTTQNQYSSSWNNWRPAYNLNS